MDKKRKAINNSSSKVDQNTIDCLLEDTLIEIFEYLTVVEKVKASLVCKKWNYAIEKTWSSVKSLCIDYDFQSEFLGLDEPNQKFIPIISNFLKKYGSYLNILSLTLYGNCNIDYFRILKEIEKYCNNLTKLAIIDFMMEKNIVTDANIESLFKKNANLRRIYLESVAIDGNCLLELQPFQIEEVEIVSSKIRNTNCLLNFLKKLKNVKKMKYACSQYNDPLMTKIVKALNKSNCESIEDFTILNKGPIDGLSELIFKQKNIKKLQLLDSLGGDRSFMNDIPKQHLEVLEMDFSDYDRMSYYSLHEFKNLRKFKSMIHIITEEFMHGLTKCENLRELDISEYSSTNSWSKTKISYFSQLKNLESIKIHLSSRVIDDILVALSQLKNLKHLDLDDCQFSERGLNNLAVNSFPNLKYLIVNHTDITNKELINLVDKSPKLEKIDISSCKNITKKFCEIAKKIKNDRQDKYILKLIIHKFDNIFKIKHLYNGSSLLSIEEEVDKKKFDHLGISGMDWENNFTEVLMKIAKAHFNVEDH